MATKDKTTYARKWRKDRRENRRVEIFAMQYLRCKYSTIRDEIQKKFGEINAKYPKKNNLTKTPEFAVWKSDVALSQPPSQQTTTAPQEPAAQQQTTTAPQEPAAQQQTTTAPQEPAAQQQTTTAPQEPAAQQQTTTATTTTTTVLNTSEELTTLCDDMMHEDPWMLNLDTAEMARIIEDLSNDPDLQAITDTFNT